MALEPEVRGDATYSEGLVTPHKPDCFTKESSQVVTPAPTRTDLLQRSSCGLTLDIDIIDGAQWTQKPSCRVQTSQHTRAGGTHGSFVEAGGSEINKDESTTAGGARTEDPHHDALTTRQGFLIMFFFFKCTQTKELDSVPGSALIPCCMARAMPGADVKVSGVAPAFRMPTVRCRWSVHVRKPAVAPEQPIQEPKAPGALGPPREARRQR